MGGIYLHIPFCLSRCIYCGFYSVVEREQKEKFIPALKEEIKERRNFFDVNGSDESVRTLYIGGGTPSTLKVKELEEIASAINSEFSNSGRGNVLGDLIQSHPNSSEEFEFTIEVNPDDVTPEYASSLKALGVNRISMGVQSFCDEHLRWMHRRHTARQGVRAFEILRRVGFDNISIDLIFGFAGLDENRWRENLSTACELGADHISAYQMSIDEGTVLEALAKRGSYTPPSDEVCYRQYSALQEYLDRAGYAQYEVSNFAKGTTLANCRKSLHNSNYWNRTPYLGLGPGAHSFIGNVREWNLPDIKGYNNLEFSRGREELSPVDEFNERLMLGLRQSEGIVLGSLDPERVAQIDPVIERLQQQGCLQMRERPAKAINIPPEKMFISDAIIRELFVP